MPTPVVRFARPLLDDSDRADTDTDTATTTDTDSSDSDSDDAAHDGEDDDDAYNWLGGALYRPNQILLWSEVCISVGGIVLVTQHTLLQNGTLWLFEIPQSVSKRSSAM
jgi:hypothetical protein